MNNLAIQAWAAVVQAIAAIAAFGVAVLLYKVTKQYVEYTKALVEGNQLQAEAARLIIVREERERQYARLRYVSALLVFARRCTGMREQLERDDGLALYPDGQGVQMELDEISSAAHDVGEVLRARGLTERGYTMLKTVIGFPFPIGERRDAVGSLRAIEAEVRQLLHLSDSEPWPSDMDMGSRFGLRKSTLQEHFE